MKVMRKCNDYDIRSARDRYQCGVEKRDQEKAECTVCNETGLKGLEEPPNVKKKKFVQRISSMIARPLNKKPPAGVRACDCGI